MADWSCLINNIERISLLKLKTLNLNNTRQQDKPKTFFLNGIIQCSFVGLLDARTMTCYGALCQTIMP